VGETLGFASIRFWSRSDRLLYSAITVDQKQDWSRGTIYATACHASLCTTALDWVSVVTAATQRLLLYTNTAWEGGGGD